MKAGDPTDLIAFPKHELSHPTPAADLCNQLLQKDSYHSDHGYYWPCEREYLSSIHQQAKGQGRECEVVFEKPKWRNLTRSN